MPTQARPIALVITLLLAAGGCAPKPFDPSLATAPYPAEAERLEVIDIQVFRDTARLDIVNSTPTSYRDVTVWVNRRYARALEELPAGRTVRLSLWDFRDERGEVFNAGGFLRTREPTPVRLVELELPGEDGGRIGLITIRAEIAQ